MNIAALNSACLGAFSEAVIFRRTGQDDHPLQGIFDAKHEMIEITDAGEVSTFNPVLSVKLADLPTPPTKQKDRFVIRDQIYPIWDVQPDGQGWAKIILKKAVS